MNKAKYQTNEMIRDAIMVEHDTFYAVETVRRKVNRISGMLEQKEFKNKCCKGTHMRWRKAKRVA